MSDSWWDVIGSTSFRGKLAWMVTYRVDLNYIFGTPRVFVCLVATEKVYQCRALGVLDDRGQGLGTGPRELVPFFQGRQPFLFDCSTYWYEPWPHFPGR